jgi:hypothetical protein
MPELFDRTAPEKISFPGVYDNPGPRAEPTAPATVPAAATPKAPAKAKATKATPVAAEATPSGRKSLKLGKTKG